MKILHILHSLKYSGAEIMYVNAASEFQKMGCELSVMATSVEIGEYTPFFENAGYRVFHYPIPNLKKIRLRIQFYLTIIRFLKKEKFDVLHIHSFKALWIFSICTWFVGSKSVFTFHGILATRNSTYLYHIFSRFFIKKILKCKFHTISDSVCSYEEKFYFNKTTKIFNWYNNTDMFPANNIEKAEARRNFYIEDKDFVIISIGACTLNKRHTDIIKALQVIRKTVPNCVYLHLGEGEFCKSEKQIASNLGVINNIRFCGNQTNIRQYLIASDVYLMTSVLEGISITTIEAMACGIPAILYDVPGLRDFNKNGKMSILIPEEHNKLANECTEIYLKRNSNNDMVMLAKNNVNKLYNMKHNSKEIFSLYNFKINTK